MVMSQLKMVTLHQSSSGSNHHLSKHLGSLTGGGWLFMPAQAATENAPHLDDPYPSLSIHILQYLNAMLWYLLFTRWNFDALFPGLSSCPMVKLHPPTLSSPRRNLFARRLEPQLCGSVSRRVASAQSLWDLWIPNQHFCCVSLKNLSTKVGSLSQDLLNYNCPLMTSSVLLLRIEFTPHLCWLA